MKQLGPNIKKYPGYLLCTTYLEFLPALNYPPLPKKKWVEVWNILYPYIHTYLDHWTRFWIFITEWGK